MPHRIVRVAGIVELNGRALDDHHLVAAFEVHDERRVGPQVAGGNRLGVRREEDLPSSHTAQTGLVWGRPSGRLVQTP
jgi:hypothetical protein